MNIIKRSLIIFVIGFAGTFIASCGMVDVKPPPTRINAAIRAVEEVNPDDSQRPSPIAVRIYALKSVGTFNASDFHSLYNDDEDTLGGDLVKREEMILKPGDQKVYARELPPESLYLGVVAGYRQLQNARWKASIPVPGGRTTNMTIDLNALSVSIQAE